MIEAIVNSETRKANLKLDGDGLTLFQETVMLITGIYNSVQRQSELDAETFIGALRMIIPEIQSGNVSPIKNSEQIAINPAFKKFMEDYNDD